MVKEIMSKVVYYILLLGWSVNSVRSLDVCESQPDGGRLAYPNDCSRFIECYGGQTAAIRYCPFGLHFNRYESLCDFKFRAACDLKYAFELMAYDESRTFNCNACHFKYRLLLDNEKLTTQLTGEKSETGNIPFTPKISTGFLSMPSSHVLATLTATQSFKPSVSALSTPCQPPSEVTTTTLSPCTTKSHETATSPSTPCITEYPANNTTTASTPWNTKSTDITTTTTTVPCSTEPTKPPTAPTASTPCVTGYPARNTTTISTPCNTKSKDTTTTTTTTPCSTELTKPSTVPTASTPRITGYPARNTTTISTPCNTKSKDTTTTTTTTPCSTEPTKPPTVPTASTPCITGYPARNTTTISTPCNTKSKDTTTTKNTSPCSTKPTKPLTASTASAPCSLNPHSPNKPTSSPGNQESTNKPSLPINECSTVRCASPGKCAGQREGALFADDFSNGYIVCQCECEIKMACPADLVFNSQQQVCDWPLS